MNALYLRRRLKVTVPAANGETPLGVIAALQKNLESLGFILSPEVCARLEKLSAQKIEVFYKDLVSALREMVGAYREFRPFYPNFPAQVMELSDAELYWNAIVHYCTNKLLPFAKRERTPLLDQTSPKLIALGTREEFEQIFMFLVSSKTSLSAQDKTDLAWFVSQYRDGIRRLLPDDVTHKENLALVGAVLMKHTGFGREWLSPRIKTPTDVLRVAVAMSDGDTSLAEPAKFTRFSRGERRLLLSWVERAPNPAEDMLRWKGRWIRLGERLHPGEYAKQFPRTHAAFDVLRNDRHFETFNSMVERHLASGDGSAVVALLQSRPGELTRRLDHLLRSAREPAEVVAAFAPLAEQVATPVLLQAMTHFAQRPQPGALRTFFPKGDLAKVQAIPQAHPQLPSQYSEAIVRVCETALLARFAKLPALGTCFLDPQLANFLVPFSQRSASKALRTLARGSRLPLPEGNVLRFFIWWKNGAARTDIDLSAALYDDAFRYVDVVSYYNLKTFGGCHSGDIVDAPNGASEFIDLNVKITRSKGVRYVVMSINSYTMQPYCDLPECFAGWMARQSADSGEIFEPRTVRDKVDVSSNTQICLPAIFDLHDNSVIWTDIALRHRPYWNNVESNLSGVSLMLQAMIGLKKPTLHALFSLHIKARGEFALSREGAQTVFAPDEGITPFDLDRIAADFL